MEKALPGRKAKVGGWTDGVALTASVQGGHGSSTSYPQNASGKNKRPGKAEVGKQEKKPYWEKPKSFYTQHHSD